MSIKARQVKNKRNQEGVSTARAGTVYDVNIRYKTNEGYKSYGKRGFVTKQEALNHEAEMRAKLTRPGFQPLQVAESKQTVKEYLDVWVENHGKVNLRPSTFAGYDGYVLVNDPGSRRKNKYAYPLATIIRQARTSNSFMICSLDSG